MGSERRLGKGAKRRAYVFILGPSDRVGFAVLSLPYAFLVTQTHQ
jgi:hypothetical protein